MALPRNGTEPMTQPASAPRLAATWRIPAAFLLLTLICCLDQVLLGPYAVVRFHDIFDVEFVHYLNQGRLFLEHGLFFWYPEYCGGLPSFAGHHAPYYPMTLMATVAPLWLIYLLFRLGLGLAAGLGLTRFLREYLGVDRDIALFSGASFALTALLLIPHFVFALAFPLVFMILRDFCDPSRSGRSKALGLAGLLALCWVSYPVLALPHYPLLHLALFLAYGLKSPGRVRHFWVMILFWAGYGLMQAPLIAGLFEYIPFTQRIYDLTPPDFWPSLKILAGRFAKILIQDEPLFPMAVCALPLLSLSRRCRPLVVLALLVGLMHAFFVSPFKTLVAATILGKMDLGNITQTLPLLYALIAGVVLDENRRLGLGPRLVWAGLGVLVMSPFLSAHHVLMAAFFTLAACAQATLGPNQAPAASAAMARFTRLAPALSAFGLAMAGMMILHQNLVGHSHVHYAKGFAAHPALAALARESAASPFRVACLDLHPTVPQSNGLEVVEQKSVLFNKYFKRLFKEAVRPQLTGPGVDPAAESRFDREWYHLFLGLPNVHDNLFLTFHPGKARTAQDLNLNLLAMLNVRYLISSKPVAGLEGIGELVATDPGLRSLAGLIQTPAVEKFYSLPLWIYRLRASLDRVSLAPRAKVLRHRDDVPGAVAGQTARDIGRTVFFAAEDLPPGFVPAEQDVSDGPVPAVDLVSLAPDRLLARGTSPAGGFLVVANNFDPKWTARVNGQATPLVRANHAFQALRLAPGPFEAELVYRDPLVAWLHLPALAGLALLLGLAGFAALRADNTAAPLDPPPFAASDHPWPDQTPTAWPVFLAAGAVAAVLWAGLFFLFVLRKYADDPTPTGYALLTIPFIGLGLALWAGGLWRSSQAARQTPNLPGGPPCP